MGWFAKVRSALSGDCRPWFDALPEVRELTESERNSIWRSCKRSTSNDFQSNVAGAIGSVLMLSMIVGVTVFDLPISLFFGALVFASIAHGPIHKGLEQKLILAHLPRFLPDHCRHCGYDLRVSPLGACPECGQHRKRTTYTKLVAQQLEKPAENKPVRSFRLTPSPPPPMPDWFADLPELIDVDESEREGIWLACRAAVRSDWRHWLLQIATAVLTVGVILVFILRTAGIWTLPAIILTGWIAQAIAGRLDVALYRRHLAPLLREVCVSCGSEIRDRESGVCSECGEEVDNAT